MLKHILQITLSIYLAATSVSGLASESLLKSGAPWKWFKGSTEASTPAGAWRDPAFNDTAWLSGSTPFFYGKDLTNGTLIADMKDHYSSIFLRAHFNIPTLHDDDGLTIETLSDDGFILWINGSEVLRYNLPTGEVAATAVADFAPDPTQTQTRIVSNAKSLLKAGDNVVAVQAFNASVSSSDFLFDLALSAFAANSIPPRIISTDPSPGDVSFFDELTVNFSEAVRGLDASDIHINGRIPAGFDKLSDSSYRFYFAQPNPGRIEVTWALQTGILNFGTPPLLFAPEAGKEVLVFNLIDAEAPSVTTTHPVAGSALTQLEQVVVTFNEPVQNVRASDLLVNGIAATNVTGIGSGPYVFSLASQPSGTVTFSWSPSNGIVDTATPPNPLINAAWAVSVTPNLSRTNLVITEFLTGNYATNGLRDETGELQDWIEIRNAGPVPVRLLGWSLSDDPQFPGRWVFPDRVLPAGAQLVVFASGFDRRPIDPKLPLHTNFKLSRANGFLGLFSPDSPRIEASSVNYPTQRNQLSFGLSPQATWRFYSTPTPGATNGPSDVANEVATVQFSEDRGVFKDPFQLYLSCPTPGSTILYTTNGNDPSPGRGLTYTGPLSIRTNTLVRAAAYKPGLLPSATRTRSFLFQTTTNFLALPIISLVTDTNNLYGPTGILQIQGGRYVLQGDTGFWEKVLPTDYHNPSQTGVAWERPASFEWIEPLGGSSFQAECGIRTHTSLGSRLALRADSKFSFRTSFRGTYGDSKLNQSLFPNAGPVVGYDNLVLRAGHFDDTNPFLNDELTRRLFLNMGHLTSHGTMANLFLNGVHQGYYNPVERLDGNFYRLWHRSTNEFDVIVAYGESREGDQTDWESLLDTARGEDASRAEIYMAIDAALDLDNFADYMLLNLYGDAADWTDSNWTVYREKTPGAKFRYSVWDSEFSYGIYNRDVNNNSLTDPRELGLTTEISTLWNALRKSPEFRLRFADRLHKQMFNGGALTDEHILAVYTDLKNQLLPSIPDFATHIEKVWIPKRRGVIFGFLKEAGLFASDIAPVLNSPGGLVPAGTLVGFQPASGVIYYTLNGADPRQEFSSLPRPTAFVHTAGATIPIQQTLTLKARVLANGIWSALLEVPFRVGAPSGPVQITELMYQPFGGDAYEFLELRNVSSQPFDLSGASFGGINFIFPEGSKIPGNAYWILASNADPAGFAKRYPALQPFGYFSGKLSNSGERISLTARNGATLLAFTYRDNAGWPKAANGSGPSLEPINPAGPLNDPANWTASTISIGTPGSYTAPALPTLRINELSPAPADPWIEIANTGASPVDLAAWSLTDDGNTPQKFVFASGQKLNPGQFITVNPTASGVALSTNGGALFLYDPSGNRVDAVTYGWITAGYAVGRASDTRWTLTTTTTKGATNITVALAAPAALRLNEWLANSPQGGVDWVELFNSSTTAPAAIQGLHIRNGNTIAQIQDLSFIPPRGFVQLVCDENPLRHHLEMKLSAQASELALLDAAGAILDQATYPNQTESVTYGRVTDGATTLVAFPGAPTPGAPNHQTGGSNLRISEIMAYNATRIPDARGRFVDWIELQNPLTTPVSTAGFRLEAGKSALGTWTFPANLQVPALGRLVIWFDPASPATTAPPFNSALGLPREGGTVRLLDATGTPMDSVTYGNQARDFSIGLSGGSWALLQIPTPGTANTAPAALAQVSSLHLNEWLANPASGPDLIEFYNDSPLPVSLSGLSMSDSLRLAARGQYTFPPLSFIAPGDWAVWSADNSPSNLPGHMNFSLNADGDGLYLFRTDGSLLFGQSFGPQSTGVSQGAIPDGSNTYVSFPTTASPGSSNHLPAEGIVINEILAHTDPPLDDAIELANLSSSPVSIGGWFISDDPRNLKAYQIPSGTTVPANGTTVLYQSFLVSGKAAGTRFALDSAIGDTLYVSEADAAGNLTGRRLQITFGATAHGVSLGRVLTSDGVDYAPLQGTSFGADSATTLEAFQRGTGAPNKSPLVGPIVLTEIHYSPLDTLTRADGTSVPAEFIELFNSGSQPAILHGINHPENPWRIANAVDYTFPPSTSLSSNEVVVLVPFNPAVDTSALAAFKKQYSTPETTRFFGPYVGRLNGNGETVELWRPDFPQGPTDEHPGLIPQLLVEQVAYRPISPWPADASQTGLALQRRSTSAYANEATNWQAGRPNPGTASSSSGPIDTDGDGLPDDWELAWGFDPRNPSDAALDSDGDGLSNLEEYRRGTNPRQAPVALRLGGRLENGVIILEFKAEAAQGYSLLYARSLANPVWIRLSDIAAGAARTVQVQDSAPFNPAETARFYRLVTPPLP